MHSTDLETTGNRIIVPPPNPGGEEAKQAMRTRASCFRKDAYALLKLSEEEKQAMEWACPRRRIGALADLRAFFDEAESHDNPDSATVWMNGPLFRDRGLEGLKQGVAAAVQQHDKWRRSVRFADVAENSIIWFLRLAIAAFVVVTVTVAILK